RASSPVNDPQAPVDPGSLAFQLTLNSPTPTSKTQTTPTDAETNTDQPDATFLLRVETPSVPATSARGGESPESRNQSQEEPSPSMQSLTGSDATVASQFGFQTPLSFAAQFPATKTEAPAPASPTRTAENASAADL